MRYTYLDAIYDVLRDLGIFPILTGLVMILGCVIYYLAVREYDNYAQKNNIERPPEVDARSGESYNKLDKFMFSISHKPDMGGYIGMLFLSMRIVSFILPILLAICLIDFIF